MTTTKSAVRTILTASRRYALMAGVCAATCGLAACGSDSKTTTTTGTTTGATTGSATGSTTGSTTGTTTATTGGTTTGTGACTVPNCDATLPGDLVLSATSDALMGQSAVSGSSAVNFKYVLLQNSNTNANTVKQYELSLLDYDACTFQWNHAQTGEGTYNYSVFPTAKFSFGGVYLVNGTAGAALTPGTYTVGATSGQYVAVADAGGNVIGGTGYDIVGCAGGSYEGIASGTVELTASSGTTVDGGTFNLTTSSYSTTGATGTITGAFSIGSCGGQTDTQPVAAQPDANACVLGSSGTTTAG